jgi:hypothetical protein
MFTLVKASRSISSYGFFQPAERQLFFEGQLQFAQPLRVTASTRILGRTLVGADKYMMYEPGHFGSLPDFVATRQAPAP